MRRFSIGILAFGALSLASQASSGQISAGTKPIYPIKFRPARITTVVKRTIARPMTPEAV
jgi:hypothetical protein